MAKIVNCNGIVTDVSGDTEMYGAKVLWSLYENEKNKHTAKILNEIHSLFCAVLHGGKVIETPEPTEKCKLMLKKKS